MSTADLSMERRSISLRDAWEELKRVRSSIEVYCANSSDSCVDGTCVHYPEGHAGDPCNRTDTANTCAPGFTCDGADSVCVQLLEDGAPCSGSNQCLGRCDYKARHCVSAEPYCEEPL